MASPVVDYREHDRKIWEQELEDFVPPRIFDAHCHMISRAHVPPDMPGIDRLSEVHFSTLKEWAATVYPGRETHFLVLGKPCYGIQVEAHNQMLGEETAEDPLTRVHCLATPDRTAEQVENEVKKYGFNGLKVYRRFSITGDIDNCRIHEFLTHEQMEVANDLGLWVTMHLSRGDGCADHYNLSDLEEYTTKRYPNIKWILAHVARSFTYFPIEQAVERLRDMPNIWYDLSAVTDIRPFITLFQKEDLARLFFGSDGVDAVSFHGKYVNLGKAWQTFYADESGLEFSHCEHRPILALYEQMLCVKQAANICGLSRKNVEDIFWGNASRALGLESTESPKPVSTQV